MDATVGDVLDWVTKNWASIAVLVGLFTGLVKIVRKIDSIEKSVKEAKDKTDSLDKKVENVSKNLREVNDQVSGLGNKMEAFEQKRIEDVERNDILIKGVSASLEGLHQLGANGCTSQALADLREYCNHRASS